MLKPISREEVEQFLNNHAPEKTERNTRIITVTITGPDAGSIAAGVTTALAKVARSIEARHKNTGVRVTATKIDEPADSKAKASK